MANFTCAGHTVSPIANCVSAGQLCSNRGTCAGNVCICKDGLCGHYCENTCSSLAGQLALGMSSPGHFLPGVSHAFYGTAGIGLPAAVFLGLGVGIIAFACIMIKRRRHHSDKDWEIDFEELEVGEQLGVGGYGEVYKAVWKGTEVAIKVIIAEKVNPGIEKSFKDEVTAPATFHAYGMVTLVIEQVRVMMSLRHPNVVLFMAASTKPPCMCIVMEYMTLGSLYDVRISPMIRKRLPNPFLPIAIAQRAHFPHSF